MGSVISQTYVEGKIPEEIPDSFVKPTFDPEYGFSHPRKPRVSQISIQEMKALKIPKNMRDYCAHFYKDLTLCVKQHYPITGLCKPELHALYHCRDEDYTIRLKEYEREKRLRMRELRKQQKSEN